MENIGNLLNDNERFKKPSSGNDNVNDKRVDDDTAENIAEYLVQKLDAEQSRKYFLKVAYKIPHGTIDRFLATALEKGNTPVKLFIHLTKRELRRRYGA